MTKERALTLAFLVGLAGAGVASLGPPTGAGPDGGESEDASRARRALELAARDGNPGESAAVATGSAALAGDVAAQATDDSRREPGARPEEASSRGPASVGAASVPARPAPARPGGSELYSGARGGKRLREALAAGASPDQKAAQLERSQDVAEKRGTIIGRIERVNGTEIAGWAYAWDDVAAPIAVSVFVDGVLVGAVPATAPRPDLAAQDATRVAATHGWSVPAPASLQDKDRHVVEALAQRGDGDAPRALESSPWALGGVQFPSGVLAYASPTLVYGWATDPQQPAAPVSVALTGDATPLGKVATLGQGHNQEAWEKALALAPQRKLTIVVPGISDAKDPNLPAAIQAAAQKASAENRYSTVRPLASAASDPNVAYDELDFFASDAQGNAIPLPGQELAGVKLQRPGEDVQIFAWQPAQPLAASWISAQVASADGSLAHELAGSPRQLGDGKNQLPYGAVSFVNDVQISGWAVDPDVLPAPISVDVWIDGAYVQRIPADKCFAALPSSVPLPDANHAFTFAPPEAFKDGKTHSIQFFAVNQPDGVNPELKGSPASFVGQRNANPIGFLDAVTADLAAGWAYDPDAGAAPTSVEVWVDNALWKTVPANATRPDLVPIVTAEPDHGYSVPLPDSLKDGKPHTVRVFALNFPDGPKQELSGSPKELNAQQPWFGIHLQDATGGISITAVDQGSPAAQGGIVGGDTVRSFDGISDNLDVSAFIAWAKTKEVGESVVFRLWHDPAQSAPAPASSPAPQGTAPLGPGERIVVVTVGSR